MEFQKFCNFLELDGTIILTDKLSSKGRDILFYLTEKIEKEYVVVDAKELKDKRSLVNAMKEAETGHKLFFLDDNALNLPKSPEREEIANVLFYLIKGDMVEGVDSQRFPILVANVPSENSFDFIGNRMNDFTYLCCKEIEGLDFHRDGSSCTVYESSNNGTVKVTHSDFIQPSFIQEPIKIAIKKEK